MYSLAGHSLSLQRPALPGGTLAIPVFLLQAFLKVCFVGFGLVAEMLQLLSFYFPLVLLKMLIKDQCCISSLMRSC